LLIDITICYSPADSAAAEALCARLEHFAEAKIWREELQPGDSLPDIWDRGLASAGMLLLLSPDSLPAKPGREPWREVLEHLEHNREPELGTVMVRPCSPPPILRRKNAFDIDSLPELQRWAIGLHALSGPPSFVPAPLRLEGSRDELDGLFEAVIEGRRTAVSASSAAVAHAFAHEARSFFLDVLWVDCAGRSRTMVCGEIADLLGTEKIEDHLRDHRLLVILDGAGSTPAVKTPRDGRGVVLCTKPVGDGVVVPEHDLLHAMAACCPGRVPLALAARVAGMDMELARKAAAQLADVVAPLDIQAETCRLKQQFAASDAVRTRHAMVLRDIPKSKGLLPELERAYAWAEQRDWALAVDLARGAFHFLNAERRTAESCELLEQLAAGARLNADDETLAFAQNEISWLGNSPTVPRGPAVIEQGSLFSFDVPAINI
jgi:hypothetical protein